MLPIANTGRNGPVRRVDQTGDNEGVPVTEHRAVMDRYFETMGVPIVAGRAPDERDRASAPPVVVINETLARRLSPTLEPRQAVGQPMRMGGNNLVEVVAGAANVRSRRPDMVPDPELYVPFAQWPNPSMSYVLRAQGDPAALTGQVRAILGQMTPHVAPAAVRLFEEV
jgi:putative ABC transport system permease protein